MSALQSWPDWSYLAFKMQLTAGTKPQYSDFNKDLWLFLAQTFLQHSRDIWAAGERWSGIVSFCQSARHAAKCDDWSSSWWRCSWNPTSQVCPLGQGPVFAYHLFASNLYPQPKKCGLRARKKRGCGVGCNFLLLPMSTHCLPNSMVF